MARPWFRFDVLFKHCRKVLMLVDPRDVDPDVVEYYPLVAEVIVAEHDGTLRCDTVEFSRKSTVTLGNGDDAVVVQSHRVRPWEEILGVIKHNDRDPPTSEPSCLYRNDSWCATGHKTPDVEDAPCVQATIEGHWDGSVWDGCEPTEFHELVPDDWGDDDHDWWDEKHGNHSRDEKRGKRSRDEKRGKHSWWDRKGDDDRDGASSADDQTGGETSKTGADSEDRSHGWWH